MSIITAYAKVTISNGGQDLATVDLLLLELHKAFRYKDKTYTLFVHKFNSPNAHKVAVARDLGGLTASIDVTPRPNEGPTQYSLKVGVETFTIKLSDPQRYNTSTEKWVDGPKTF